MKHLTVFCLSSLLIFSLNAQINNSDAFFYGTYNKGYIIKNKIRKITVDILFNSKRLLLQQFDFDRKGFLKNQTNFNSTGKKVNKYSFEYNNYGDLIKRTETSYELNKIYIDTLEKTYKNSRLISEKTTALQCSYIYSYNSDGQKRETITILGKDTAIAPKTITNYIYNPYGNLMSKKEFVLNNNRTTTLARTTSFLYNSSGNIVEVKRSDAPSYFITYNKKNLLKSIILKMPEDLDSVELIDNYNYTFWD